VAAVLTSLHVLAVIAHLILTVLELMSVVGRKNVLYVPDVVKIPTVVLCSFAVIAI
jgi:hypothetical protein